MRKLWLSLIALCLQLSTSYADKKNPTYVDDVLPVLKQHCINCHSDDKQRGGLNIASFGATMEGGSSGEVVVAGDPDKSRLYTLTAHKEEPVMPPSKQKIPEDQIQIIRLWIEQGARETASSKASVAMKPKVDLSLKVDARGKPNGPPPMPQLGKLSLNPYVTAKRPGAVLALAVSPWAPVVAIGGQKQVLLYNTDSADLLGILPYEHGQLNSLKFSRNGKLLLAAGGRGGASGKAVLFNVETGDKITEVGEQETDAILSADLSPDQSMIAVGTTSRVIRIYSTADGSVLQTIKKHTDWVTSVEFSPDGVLLATGDRNGGIFIWEASTAREFHTIRGHTQMITQLSWRADSNLLASASLDGTIRLWEMENANQVKNWQAHGGGVEGIHFGVDGRIVSTGRDRVTKLWDGNGGLQKQFEAMPQTGLRVGLSHDNAKVVAGDWGGTVQLWTAADGKLIANLDTNPQSLEEQRRKIQAEIYQAKLELEEANKNLHQCGQTLTEQTKETNTIKTTYADLKSTKDTKEQTISEAQTTEAKITLSIKEKTEGLEKNRRVYDLAAEHAKIYESMIKTYSNSIKQLQEEAKIQPNNQLLKDLIEKTQIEFKLIETAAKEANEYVNNARKQVAELESKLETIIKDRNSIQTIIQKNKTELSVINNQLSILEKTLEVQNQKRTKLEQEFKENQTKVSEIEAKLKSLTDQIARKN